MLKSVLILVLLLAPVLMFVSGSFEGEMWTGQGGGVLNKVSYREAQPRGPAPYPFIYHI